MAATSGSPSILLYILERELKMMSGNLKLSGAAKARQAEERAVPLGGPAGTRAGEPQAGRAHKVSRKSNKAHGRPLRAQKNKQGRTNEARGQNKHKKNIGQGCVLEHGRVLLKRCGVEVAHQAPIFEQLELEVSESLKLMSFSFKFSS